MTENPREVVEVTLSVPGERFAEVVRRLRDAGFDVQEEMAALGTVVGYATEYALPALRKVPGVAAVEVSRQFRLPPPDSNIQ